MKRTIFLSAVLCLLTLLCSHTKAENTNTDELRHAIYIEPLSVKRGTTEHTLSVKMKNEYDAMGFSFSLTLPEGFSVALTGGIPDVQLSTERTNSTHIDKFESTIDDNGKLTVIASNDKGDGEITGNDGEIALVRIVLPADAAAGNYTIVVHNLSINLTNGDDAITEDLGVKRDIETTLTIDNGITLDENSTEVPSPATGVDVRVFRTIKANEWSTICLPFAMTEAQVKTAFGDDVQLGNFCDTQSEYDDADNVVGISIAFEKATEIEANHPYIIKVSQPITEFAVDNVDINPAEEDALVEVDNGLTGRRRVVYGGMYGTYHAQTELEKFSLFLNSNKFWYSTGLTKMKAFRAYFVMMDVLTDVENAAARISFSFNDRDEETTGIVSRQEQTKGGACYDLQGRKVVKPTKGLYIRNGRKEVER